MTQCIDPSDDRYFTVTSDKPYNRHHYTIVFANGQSEDYKTWEEVKIRWFETPGQFLSHIEVIDKKKGF